MIEYKEIKRVSTTEKTTLITSHRLSVMEQTQTFVHKAKNKEIWRWASAKETDESDCAPFMESFSDVPGSEN